MSIAEKLLPQFDREFSNTRKFLALVPDDRLAWKPHEKSMELGRLAWHLSDFPEWTVNALERDGLNFSLEELPKMRREWVGKTRAAMLQRFDADLKRAREAVIAIGDSGWAEPWQLKVGGRVAIDETRGGVYRNMVISHQVHHRAQLGLYLRLNDIAIPGVYGPSADEI